VNHSGIVTVKHHITHATSTATGILTLPPPQQLHLSANGIIHLVKEGDNEHRRQVQ
jgi:hypothetical protein